MTLEQCKQLAQGLKENLKLPVSIDKIELELLYFFFFDNGKFKNDATCKEGDKAK